MKRADLFAYSDEEPVCPHVLEFQAIAWSSGDEDDVDGEEEDDEDDDDEEEEARHGGDGDNLAFVVRVFGVTAEGRSVALAIRAFTPYFYIKVAPHWTPGQTRALKDFITSHKKLGVLLVRSVSKKDFYGFRNGKTDTFLRIDCRSLKASKIMAYKLQKPVQGRGIAFPAGEISLYESNIEPIIRFMHMR
ncbi:DNA polymerase, partial [Tetrabaena socialis]